MPLAAGSLVLAEYTARVKETGEVLDTTMEEEAKRLDTYDPTKRYTPQLISVGDGWVLRGLDEALAQLDVGAQSSIEIPPEKGFGLRDPNKVRMVPLRKFGERAMELRIGDQVELEGRTGTVRFIGSGRAQIDLNHRLAGKNIIYNLQVIKELTDDRDRIEALLLRRLPIDPKALQMENQSGTVNVRLPPDTYLTEGLQIMKRAAANDIFRFVKSVNSVFFMEIYEAKRPEVKVEEKKELPPPQPPSPPEEKPVAAEQKAEETPKRRARRRRVREGAS